MVKLGTRKEYRDKVGYNTIGKENCVFCNYKDLENLLWTGKHWQIIHNMYPYSGDERHLMAVPLRHVAVTYELNDEELLELKEVFKFMKEYYAPTDYFSFNRETMGHRSIEHLHLHFLPGKLQGKFLRKMLELQGFPIKEDLVF